MIEQDKLFKEFGFVKYYFECASEGCFACYEAPDGYYYKIDHFAHYYVMECAEGEYDARHGVFEDSDLFEDDLPEEEIYRQMVTWIKKYVCQEID